MREKTMGRLHLQPHKIKMNSALSLLMVLAALIVVMSILSPYFFSLKNFLNIAQYSSIAGALAIGMTFVIVGGGIDISVGSIVTFAGMMISVYIPNEGGVLGMVLLSVGLGALCGFINGIMITRLKIMPFVVTLGTMQIFKGLAFLTSEGVNTPFSNPDFLEIGRGTLMGGIPVSFVILIGILLVGIFLLDFTPFGSKLFAVGANPVSSKLAGINVRGIQLVTYVICGSCASIGGMILASQNGAGMTNSGNGMELNAIAATVIGGTSLLGGRGSIIGTFIGVVLLITVTNGLNLLGVNTYIQGVITGMLLVTAVLVDSLRKK